MGAPLACAHCTIGSRTYGRTSRNVVVVVFGVRALFNWLTIRRLLERVITCVCTQKKEARWVLNGVDPGEVAILVRASFQTRLIEEV